MNHHRFALSVLLFSLFHLIHSDAWSQGTWSTRAPLPTARQEMPLAVLQGKIHVPGGFELGGFASRRIEVYDIASDSWQSGPILPLPLHHLHLGVVDDVLYVLGGFQSSSFSPSNRVFALDLGSNSWDEKTPMPAARGAGAAVVLDGKIYVIGGNPRLTDNIAYDPASDSWEVLSPMPTRREHLAAAVIDSKIYVVGGRVLSLQSNTNVLEAYSPATDKWEQLAPMPTARGGLAAAASNGKLYAFGGEFLEPPPNPGVFNATEEYNPATNTWRRMTRMPHPGHGFSAVTVNGAIYLIGGGPLAGFSVMDVNAVFLPPGVTTEVASSAHVPETMLLHQNYPNPFNPETTIRFELAQAASVRLDIYNLLGQNVRRLVNADLPAGEHKFRWDGTESSGRKLGSGVYVYRLQSRELVLSKKMVYVQ